MRQVHGLFCSIYVRAYVRVRVRVIFICFHVVSVVRCDDSVFHVTTCY